MKSPDCDNITLCNNLLSSLSDSISAVQSFNGRWSTIGTKISTLRASTLPDLSDHSDHPLSVEILKSIVETLSTALTLCLHCRSPDPPAGKLQTQSEISDVATALDQHLADADLLLKSGLLVERRFNNVLSGVFSLLFPNLSLLDLQPTCVQVAGEEEEVVGVGEEDKTTRTESSSLRIECRSLVTRLQIGTVEQRNAAMESLVHLLYGDDKNVLGAVAQGVVPVLVRVLESSRCHVAKEKAVSAIARISAVESCRCVLIGEGLLLLNHLTRALESGRGVSKEKACVALQSLTLTKENSMAVGSRGGVSSLLEICRAGTPLAQASAAGVLRNLAAVDAIRHWFLEEKGVEILSRLCTSGTLSAQENAVGCVRNLAAGDDREMKQVIFREFWIDGIRNYWDSQSSSLEPAIGLFRHLANDSAIADQLVSSGFLRRIISATTSPSSATRTEAAKSLHSLATFGKARKEIADFDSVTQLLRMLDAKRTAEKDAAVKALASIVAVFPESRKVVKKDEKGISDLVRLLNPLVIDVEKKYPVLILVTVSHSKKNRRRMADAGARGFLSRLVDMDVEGAKKLLDNLDKCIVWEAFFHRT